MLGIVSTDARRRSSLRVVVHSLPLAILRVEEKPGLKDEANAQGDNLVLPDIDLPEKQTSESQRCSLTDRRRFSNVYLISPRHFNKGKTEVPDLSPLDVKPASKVRDEKALMQLRETYMELQVAQALPRTNFTAIRCIPLPPPTKRYTLVFDLDETLVHRELPTPSSETIITVPSGNSSYLIGLSVRPYVLQCLNELAKSWELVLFTASQKTYADAIVDYLDPSKQLFAHRLYRDHCLYVHSRPVKDLRMLQHRDPARTVIVDNSIVSFAYQLNNGVPIRAWRGCLKDREMLKINRFLKRLAVVEDVREELKKAFDLERFCSDYRKAQRLASGL